jgi:hypothetical protein
LTFFACFDLRKNTLKYPLRILKHPHPVYV